MNVFFPQVFKDWVELSPYFYATLIFPVSHSTRVAFFLNLVSRVSYLELLRKRRRSTVNTQLIIPIIVNQERIDLSGVCVI